MLKLFTKSPQVQKKKKKKGKRALLLVVAGNATCWNGSRIAVISRTKHVGHPWDRPDKIVRELPLGKNQRGQAAQQHEMKRGSDEAFPA